MEAAHHSVSVVIPAYNEEAGIGDVVEEVKRVLDRCPATYEIIVVDDGSGDRTVEAALKSDVRVIRHRKNMGYGAALKTGIRAARYDWILITDADGTYPAGSIPLLLEKMDGADMVVASRQGRNVAVPLFRRPAKWILSRLAEYITGDKIPDLNSGLRVFNRNYAIQYFNILSDRFSFTTTITVSMLSDNYIVEYVPIDYLPRKGKSKITPWHFFEFVNLVIRLSMLFDPLKIFVPAAIACFALSIFKLAFDIFHALRQAEGFNFTFLTNRVISASVLILVLSGIQILLLGMVSDGITRNIVHRRPPPLEVDGSAGSVEIVGVRDAAKGQE